MINYQYFLSIFEWIFNLFSSIKINPKDKMIKEGPLDPRWIQEEDGKYYFNFDYPIFSNENINEIYSLEDIFNCIKKIDLEFVNNNLIQDFEEILIEYRKSIYDSKISKDFEIYYKQRSIQDLEKEEENLNLIIKEYFESPLKKDEYYRNINKLKFNYYDDDPLFLYNNNDYNFIEKNLNLPKLKLLSKSTFKDREERRRILLSEIKYPFIESERIGSIFKKFQK